MRLKESKIIKSFESMKDHRVVARTLPPLRNIVFITIVGALCGMTGYPKVVPCTLAQSPNIPNPPTANC